MNCQSEDTRGLRKAPLIYHKAVQKEPVLAHNVPSLPIQASLASRDQVNFPGLPFSPSPDAFFPKFSKRRTTVEMSKRRILRLGSLKDVAQFQEHVRSLQIKIPCDSEITRAARRTGRSGFGSGALSKYSLCEFDQVLCFMNHLGSAVNLAKTCCPNRCPISHRPRPYHAKLPQPVSVQAIENIQPDFFRDAAKVHRGTGNARLVLLRC